MYLWTRTILNGFSWHGDTCCYGSGFQGLVLCMCLELAQNVLKLCILIRLVPCKIYREQFSFVFRNGLVLSAADRRYCLRRFLQYSTDPGE